MTYISLLLDYSKVPSTSPRKTLLEIANQARKELVWSRLLMHFLDPHENPKISDLFLEALTLSAHNFKEGEHVENVEVEAHTGKGKIIDILITTNRRIIVIENKNKLYAALTNDFAEYAREAKWRNDQAQKSDIELLILLTLFSADRKSDGFKNVLWGDFCKEVCARVGKLFNEPFGYDILYLQEFLSMVNNIQETQRVDDAFVNFLETHRPDIERLTADIETLRKHLLSRSIEFADEFNKIRIGEYPAPAQYNSDISQFRAVTYFDLPAANGAKVAVDVVFEPSLIHVEVFCRRRDQIADFLVRFETAGIELKPMSDSRYQWTNTFDRRDDLSKVAIAVHALIKELKREIANDSEQT